MAERKLFSTGTDAKDDEPVEGAPLGGSRTEAIHRLQVGVVGLCAMVLVMGVASAISNRAAVSENAAVPDAAPTTEPSASPSPSDPLADAGVVPVVPADGEASTGDDGDAEDETPTVPDIAPDAGPNGSRRN